MKEYKIDITVSLVDENDQDYEVEVESVYTPSVAGTWFDPPQESDIDIIYITDENGNEITLEQKDLEIIYDKIEKEYLER